MSETNQTKKPKQNPTFENRNYNRLNQTSSISQKPSFEKQKPASRPEASSKFKSGPAANQPTGTPIVPTSPSAKPEPPNYKAFENKFVKPASESRAFRTKIEEGSKRDPSLEEKLGLRDENLDDAKLVIERVTNTEKFGVRLTERDFRILEFITEMKFASKVEIFEKFFSVLKDESPARNMLWTLKRLTQLETSGFLKGYVRQTDSLRYFCATEKAYLALHQKVQTEKIPKPKLTIEQNVFVHDWLVLKSRLEFEKHNPGCKWISDRVLRAGLAQMFNLPSAYIPDAIYELSSGERVAFEFENAPKGRGAYREKIIYFAKLIEMKREDSQMFGRVRFRCVRADVFKILSEETALYPGLFSVEMWDSEFSRDAGGTVPVPKYLKEKILETKTDSEPVLNVEDCAHD